MVPPLRLRCDLHRTTIDLSSISSAASPATPPSPTTEPRSSLFHRNRRLHGEAVILAGDLNPAGQVVAHRMIAPCGQTLV